MDFLKIGTRTTRKPPRVQIRSVASGTQSEIITIAVSHTITKLNIQQLIKTEFKKASVQHSPSWLLAVLTKTPRFTCAEISDKVDWRTSAAAAQMVEYRTNYPQVGGSFPTGCKLSFRPLQFLHVYTIITTIQLQIASPMFSLTAVLVFNGRPCLSCFYTVTRRRILACPCSEVSGCQFCAASYWRRKAIAERFASRDPPKKGLKRKSRISRKILKII